MKHWYEKKGQIFHRLNMNGLQTNFARIRHLVFIAIGLFLVIDNSFACSGSLNYNSGTICANGTADIVFQGGSAGVTYQLYKDDNAIGSTINTGGASIYHISVTGVGSYQLKLSFGNTNVCTSWSSNTVTVGLKSGASISINASPSSAICRGQSVTLTAAGGYGYSWSSQVVSPLVNTTYTLTGTESACNTLSTATITVYVSPAVGQVNITAGPTSVCQGTITSSTYTASATDVNYYDWTISPPGMGTGQAGTINAITGVVTWNPNFSGTARVSVKATSGQYCMTTTNSFRDVTVMAMPSAPATSSISVPYNSTITLQANGAGPNEVYTWYTSQSATTPIHSSVGPLNTAASTYTYYAGKKNTLTGCETLPGQRSVLTVTVYVDPPGTPIISTNTCGPRTITLTPPPANCTYYWEGSDPKGTNLGSPINGIFEVPASGDFYIRSNVNGTGLWSAAIKISVTVDPVDITINSYDPANPVMQATYSITFGEGFEVPAGSTFSANIVITNECNDFVNWTEQILYDQNGVAISDSRSYFDGFGGGLESQSKDFLSKKVFAAQPIFDSYNTAAGASLPAPILESDFIYKKAIISNAGGTPYTADDFDQRTTTNVSGSGEINYPKIVGTQPGTTGWYYSSSNNIEPNTPVTSYPYSRGFTPEGPDPKVSTSASAGDEFRMGSGHETKSEKTLISTDDASKLSHYYSLRHFFSNSTTVTGKGYRYISTDANGKQAVSFVDADGRSIASAVATLASGTIYNYDYWSYTYYNDAGQVTATVAPKDVKTSDTTKPPATEFQYDHMGRLIETSSPDEGTSRFVYSVDGKIRFSENQEQRNATTRRFSYTNYDQLGRLVESGEYTATAGGYLFEPHSTITPASNSVLNIVDNNFAVPIDQVNSGNFTGISEKLDAARCSEHNFITYDLPGSGSPAAQNLLYGQVSKTENENVTTWYSYDEDGLLVWMKQSINGLGIKSIDYTYDYFGNVTQVAYQAGPANTDAFYHHYTYDINQRLTEVRTSKDGTNKTLQAKYYYYLHGPLKRVELAGNLQGIDYVYTIDGSLKSINHADVAKDPGNDGNNGVSADVFGMTLDYHPNDYQGAGYDAGIITGTGSVDYYNGLVKSSSWFTPVDNPSSKKNYKYSYDNLYQFQDAQFGSLTKDLISGIYNAEPGSSYNEHISLYDKNGNIQSLTRSDKSGNSLDNFTYNYINNTNRLDNISGSAAISYQYNDIGQLISQTENGVTKGIKYNAYGLVKEVWSGSKLSTTYKYDDRGALVKKIIYDNAGVPAMTFFFVSDVAGNVLSIYKQLEGSTVVLKEVPIYGAGRIATYKPASTTFYEINDHLGNVRAVIGAPNTETLTATMESENSEGEDKRFKNIAPRYVSPAANNTVGGNEAIRINNGEPLGGFPGRSTGAGIILHVAPGDVISAEVFGYFEGGNGYSNTIPVAAMINNVATAFGGISGATGDPGKIFSSLNTIFTGSAEFAGRGGSTDDTSPAAYLNMIMFDENMIAAPSELPMSATRLPSTADMNKQKIGIDPITIPSPGYVYIFVNNNSDVSNWVYFDDLKVTHLHSPFVAGGDYYPYGLPMDERQIKIEDYRYGYQGQYAQKDSVTGWNEFDLRMYDARTGRWISPDPYGQYASPYIGVGNNPVSGTDPNGGFCPECDALRAAGFNVLDEVVVTGSRYFTGALPAAFMAINTPTGSILKGSDGNYYDRISHANGDLYKMFVPGSGWELHRDEADVAKVYQATMKGITENMGSGYSFFLASAMGGFEAGLFENTAGRTVALKVASEAAEEILPRSGPIMRAVGAASRAEMLARKLKLNINSATTRQVLNSLDDTVAQFISKFRNPSIRSQLPGEFLNMTVEEALRSGNTTVRKLLIDSRFVKL